jgi:ligand-binding sensor domain-containing protein
MTKHFGPFLQLISLLFWGWMLPKTTLSQEVLGTRYDINSGFPSNTVFDIWVDRDGVRWFGTEEGLFRFNGVDYVKIPFEGNWSNSVSNIAETRSGELWCRNFSNQVFRFENGVMRDQGQLHDAIGNNELRSLVAVNDDLLLVTEGGVVRYNSAEDRAHFVVTTTNDRLIGLAYTGGYIALTTIGGKYMVYRDTVRVHERQLLLDPRNQPRVIAYGDGFLIGWTGVDSTYLTQIDKTGTVLREFGLAGVPVTLVNNLSGNAQQAALLNSSGAVLIDENLDYRWLNLGMRCSDYAIGRDGRFLISSLDGGIVTYEASPPELLHPSPPNAQYTALTQMGETIVAGTNQGDVVRIHPDQKKNPAISQGNGIEIQFIRYEPVRDWLITTKGILTPTEEHILYIGKDGLFRGNNLYTGTYLGLQRIDFEADSPIEEAFDAYNTNPSMATVRSGRIRAMETADDDYLYVAFADSLLCYAPGSNRVAAAHRYYGTDLCRGAGNRMWATTTDGRVLAFEAGRLEFEVERGVLNGQIGKHLAYRNDRLYVVTERGINTFVRSGEQFELDESQFVALNRLTIKGFLVEDDGFLVSSEQGILRLPFVERDSPPFVVLRLNGLLVDGQPVTNSSVPHYANSVEISWESIGYDFDKLELYYRLEPVQSKATRFSPSTGKAWFNELAAGDYRFHLFATHRGEVLPFGSMQFSVAPPFWLTWWFIALEVLAGLVIVWVVVRLSQRSLRKKQFYRERLIQSKLTALRSQMNPHFLYNALNSLQGMIYGGQINQAGNYVSKFSDYLRNVLKYSDVQLLTVLEEISALRTYLEIEQERFGDDFIFDITVDSDVDQNVELPTMIIQPFVENAIKHGLMNKQGAKRLHVQVSTGAKGLVVNIIDNGIGRDAAQAINRKRTDKPSSFATRAIDERIHLFNHQGLLSLSYTLDDAYPELTDKGTQVRITINTP